ncbi:hypothetical protein PANT111_460066 [Pantoea brenneri]|nr:hypothetical protein PANT111_460066 [Pantoea brenneri]
MSQPKITEQTQRSKINPPVFYSSAILIFIIVAFAAIFPEQADKQLSALQSGIFANAS